MSQRVLARATLGALAVAMACGCLPTAAQEPAPRNSVRIEGNVAQPISLSLEELRRLPARTVDNAPRGEGGTTAPPRRYTGALLRDVITAAKPTERAPLEPNEGPIAIIAASDRGSARHVKWLTTIKLEAIAP